MTANTKQVPALRFPEFEGEWRKLILGEIGDFKNGLNKSKEDFGFGVPFINLMDVFGKTFLQSNHFGLVNASVQEVENYNLKKGDVLFIRSSVKREGVGETSTILEDLPNTVYSGFLIRFRENSNPPFLDINFKKFCFSVTDFRTRLVALSSTSANTNINQESLSSLELIAPSLPEQQKIASFLTAIDEKLQQLSRKKALLEQYKKGVMQKIFSQEIRFKPDDGGEYQAWEEKMLGEVATFINGRAYKDQELLESGKYPVLRVGNFFTSSSWYYSDLELDESKYCQNGDLLYAWSASFGPRIWEGEKTIYHYHIWKVDIKTAIDRKFLYYVLDYETAQLKASSSNGFALLHITKGTIEKWKCWIPALDEQQKIAAFISAIDEKINQATTQLQKARQWKKGLLQGMFV